MRKLEKVATPPTAVTVVLPTRIAPSRFGASDNVTWSLKQVTRCAEASRASTLTAGSVVPAASVFGCPLKARLTASQDPIELSG